MKYCKQHKILLIKNCKFCKDINEEKKNLLKLKSFIQINFEDSFLIKNYQLGVTKL